MAPADKPETVSSIISDSVKPRVRLLGGSIAVLWIVNLLNTIAGHRLDVFGIHPRTLEGLWGILFAPFLHAGFGHLLANTISLAIFGSLVMLRRTRDFVSVSLIAALTSGLGAWLVGGANTVHLGASGVIFGLLGFLLSRGVFERRFWSIAGSVLALLFFGGALRGLFPGVPGVSWEAHMFGFLGGILAARLAARQAKAPTAPTTAAAKKRIAAPAPRARIDAPAEEEVTDDEIEALRRRMRG